MVGSSILGSVSKVGTAGTSKWERSCDPLGTLRMPSGSRAYAHLDVPLGTLFPKWETVFSRSMGGCAHWIGLEPLAK